MAIVPQSFSPSGASEPRSQPFVLGSDGRLDLARGRGNQPPSPFAVLGVPERMELDLSLGELQFRSLIRQLHPDRFFMDGAQAVDDAQRHTAWVNDAWRVVRDPIRRVQWLLEHVARQPAAKLPADLAMRAFERNELADEWQADPPALAAAVAELRAELAAEKAEIDRELAGEGRRWDQARDRGDEAAARQAGSELALLLARLPYVDNLLARTTPQ